MIPAWLTRNEAGAYLGGYDPGKIDSLSRQGKLKRYRLDGSGPPRYKREELDALMVEAFQKVHDEPEGGE